MRAIKDYSAEKKKNHPFQKRLVRKEGREGGGFRGNVSTGIQGRVSEKGESRNKRVCCSLPGSVYYPKAVQREKAKGIKGDRKNERAEEKGSPLYFHGRLDGR